MAAVSHSLKKEVLRTYRAIMRVSKTWKATEGAETETERAYIRNEARELFRKNKNLVHEGEIKLCLTEANSRLEMAHHYKNPYPRPVNFAPGYVVQSRKKKTQMKRTKQATPSYTHSKDLY